LDHGIRKDKEPSQTPFVTSCGTNLPVTAKPVKIRSAIVPVFLDKLLLRQCPILKEMCGESVVILENKI
jgi:hypothetical protein